MADAEKRVTLRIDAETDAARDDVQRLTDVTQKLGTGADEAAAELRKIADSERAVAGGAGEVEVALGAVEGLLRGITERPDPFEVQREHLLGVRDGLEDVIQDLQQWGPEGAAQAEKFRASIDLVNAELLTLEARAKGSTEAMGDSGNAAAEAMSRAAASVDDVADKMSDASAEGRRLTTTLGDVAQQGRTGFDGVDKAMEKLRRSQAELTDKFDSGAKITVSSTDKVIQAQRELELELKKIGKTADDLGGDFKQTYDTAQREIDEAKLKVRELSAAVQQQRGDLKEAGAEWKGLGNAIKDMLGPQGAALAQMGLYTAALKEGLSIGTEVAKFMGTDFREAESVWAGIQKQVHAVNNEMVSLVASVANVAASLGSANTQQLGADIRDFELQLQKVIASFHDSEAGAKAFDAAVAAGLPTMERAAVVADNAAKVADFYGKTQRGGAEGQHLWNEAVREGGGTAEGLVAAISKLDARARELIDVTGQSAEAMRREAEEAERLRAKLQELDNQSESLKNKREAQAKADYDATVRMIEMNTVTNGMTKALAEQLSQVSQYLPQSERFSVQLDRKAAALQQVLNATDGLTKAEREHLQTIITQIRNSENLTAAERVELDTKIRLALAAGQLSDAQTKVNVEIEKGRLVLSNLAGEAEKAARTQQDIAASAEAAANAIDLGAGNFIRFSDQTKKATTETGNFGQRLEESNEALSEQLRLLAAIAEASKEAAASLNEYEESAKRASTAGLQ